MERWNYLRVTLRLTNGKWVRSLDDDTYQKEYGEHLEGGLFKIFSVLGTDGWELISSSVTRYGIYATNYNDSYTGAYLKQDLEALNRTAEEFWFKRRHQI